MAITNSLQFYENGDLTDADQVLSNTSFVLNNMLAYALDGATTTSQNNLKMDFFTSDTAASTSDMHYNSGDDAYDFYHVDDEIDDSSYSANWTASGTGTTTEDTSKLSNSAAASPASGDFTQTTISNGTSPIDYYNSNKDCWIKCRVVLSGAISSTGGYNDSIYDSQAKFGLTDGANTVWIKTIDLDSDVHSLSDDSVWEIWIDASADTCDTYDDGVLDQSGLDISSLTGGNYYIVLWAYAKSSAGSLSANASADIYYLYSMGTDYSSGEVVTTATSLSSSADMAITKYTTSNMDSGVTPSLEVSTDNGANYDSASDGVVGEITTPGTNLKHKFTFAAPTGDLTPSADKTWGSLNNYATYYG